MIVHIYNIPSKAHHKKTRRCHCLSIALPEKPQPNNKQFSTNFSCCAHTYCLPVNQKTLFIIHFIIHTGKWLVMSIHERTNTLTPSPSQIHPHTLTLTPSPPSPGPTPHRSHTRERQTTFELQHPPTWDSWAVRVWGCEGVRVWGFECVW